MRVKGDWDFYTPSNLLGRTRYDDEMGVICGISVYRFRSASILTAKSGYLRIIKRSKIVKD